MDRKGQCLEYETGTAEIKIHFPSGRATCQYCEYLYAERNLGRCRCRLQRDKIIPLENIEFGRDTDCPIKFEESEVKK